MATERKILVPSNFNKNELRNARVQNLASAPGSPVAGQIYYDTVANKLYYYNGSAWVAADGSSVTFATPAIVLGSAAAAGSAGTVIRSDATIAAFDATPPAASAVGDSAAVGSAAFAARRDHKHAREAFGAVTPQTSFGAASADGSAATVAHSDHGHGTPTHDGPAHSGVSISSLAAPTADVPWNSKRITGLLDPASAQDAATKAYVDATATGLDVKASVKVSTQSNISLTAPGATIDGITMNSGDRMLVRAQTTASENGIYVWNGASSTATRAGDADTSAEVMPGMFTFVEQGTDADSGYILTTDAPITLGTTALAFSVFSRAGDIVAGAGLTKSGQTINVGAGTGILANADDVAVDTTVVVRKYATSIGNGSATSFTVTHNLGTLDVTVEVYENSSGDSVEVGINHTTTNTLTIDFSVAPTSNQYRVVVHG